MENQKEQTVTYGVGRFIIEIPSSMKYRGGAYSMRIRDIKEIALPEGNYSKFAEREWEAHLAEVKQLKPVENMQTALIEEKDLAENMGKMCKAIYYYGDSFDEESGYLDIFLGSGPIVLWIKTNGKITARDFMYEKSTDIAKAYRPPTESTGKAEVIKGRDSFYLRYGAVDLPFEYKESAEVYFKGHTFDENLDLSIETRVIHKEKTAGLLERAAAAITSNYAPGVKIKKVRSGKRTVAGLDGEELIEIMAEDGEKMLSLSWMYLGNVDSGQYPHVIIDMNAEDSHMDKKIVLWDAILDSMRPASK